MSRTAVALFALAAVPASGQSLEPRAYSPAPVGMNFLVAGSAFTRGGIAEDPNLPLTDPRLRTSSGIFGYVRTLDAGGRLGRVEVVVPLTHIDGEALYQGLPVERRVTGVGDPSMRLSVILKGVPALTPREFRSFRQGWLLGASVQVTAPLGQYDPERLVNIGTNRWTVRPEVAVSKGFGRLVLEATAAASIYSDNPDFFGGVERTQSPLFATRMHASWSFPRGGWVSFDTTYFEGGRTTVGGTERNDLASNWRSGVTATVPLPNGFSLRGYASKGVSTRTGNNFDLAGLAIQYRWLDRGRVRPLADAIGPDMGL